MNWRHGVYHQTSSARRSDRFASNAAVVVAGLGAYPGLNGVTAPRRVPSRRGTVGRMTVRSPVLRCCSRFDIAAREPIIRGLQLARSGPFPFGCACFTSRTSVTTGKLFREQGVDASSKPRCFRDQEQSRPDKNGPGDLGDAVTGRRKTFDGDGCSDDSHCAQVHDPDDKQRRH
jgi:hypothetical protein